MHLLNAAYISKMSAQRFGLPKPMQVSEICFNLCQHVIFSVLTLWSCVFYLLLFQSLYSVNQIFIGCHL